MKKPLTAILLALLIILTPLTAWAEAPDMSLYAPGGQLSDAAIEAESAILIDRETGTVLYEKDADLSLIHISSVDARSLWARSALTARSTG